MTTGKGPNVSKQDARTLYNFLRGRGFVKRKHIPPDLFGNNDQDRRKVRAICQAYPEHFLSTQDGYCITAEAKDARLEESIADLRAKARSINDRADGLQKALDRRVNTQEVLI